ncbi:MAG TPA: glycoside hydrolase family 38 C-terminal domain-containing protein [Armatimonadota bacterium]|nr:glycoside hydrolase family 38 C-terminal domain-containing protein [Armatimonadota bacterium]
MAREPAKIHLVPHFHYDPVWIEDQRTYTNRAFDLVQGYLDACRQDDKYHVMLSELDYLRPFLATFSDHRPFFNELVAAGRIAAGGAYNQPNEMLIQGEPLIRNLIYGRLYHEGVIAAKPTVYLPLDVFGHCLQLPQIAHKAGFQAIIWSKNIIGAPPLCLAISPDGTTLLQKREPYWYYPETFEQLLDTVADGLEHQAALGLDHDLRLLGHDMGEPRPWLAAKSSELAGRDPVVVLSTPDKYLAAVQREIQTRRISLPVSGRDLSWYHLGTTLTRADLKIANRLAENRLLGAEKWATLAGLLGAIYPDAALDKAWRQILFGQHHDALTGVSSDIPYLDLLAGYREALDLAVEVESRALSYIGGRVDTAAGRRAPRDGAALIVFNALGWPRTDVCRARLTLDGPLASGFKLTADNGREVPCQLTARSDKERWAEIAFIAADIPSLGYRTYYLAPAPSLPEDPTFGDSADGLIENDLLSVTADPARGGALTSIYSKTLDKEFVNPNIGPANELIALSEDPHRQEAPWEIFTTGRALRSGDSSPRLQIMKGPVLSRLRITSALPDRCDLVQEVTLYRGLARIDLRTTIRDYRGQHELLALTFPLDIRAARPTFEDRFATVVRRPSQGRLDFRTLEEHNLSRCGLGAAQNWVDVGPSPSLHITSGNRRIGAIPLSPCVIVTSTDLKDRSAARLLLQALLARGVTCTHRLDTHDPEDDPAACAFRISLGRRNAYSAELLKQFPQAASRLPETNGSDRWSGVLLRRPDPSRQWPDVPVLIAEASSEGDLAQLAELLAGAIQADDLTLPESRDFSELGTPADDCGLALINRGSLAASLENDGTLVAPLFHTSSWSTYPWGEGMLDRFFIPEHKTHVFEHSLYPHEGDWRAGAVVKVGHEVNTPLRAAPAPVRSGVLPTSFGLLSTETPNLVIAALKPLGNPLASHHLADTSKPENGLLLRAYESAGTPVSASLQFAAAPEAAWTTDLLENKERDLEISRPGWRRPAQVQLDLPACSIISLAVKLPPLAEAGPPKDLGPSAEPYTPIHSRYWDHNLGAAPVGNLPVSLWMRGQVAIGKNTRFSLGLSNDSLDREISGSVTMVAPEAWTMIPRQLPYRIPPNSPALYEVMVTVPEDTRPCFIRAITEQFGQQLQDVIPIGDIEPLEVSLQRDRSGFLVRVRNPNADYVEGHLTLITPLESWGDVAEGCALSAVRPRLHPFRIEANAEQQFLFEIRGETQGIWAIAKAAWYGNLQYAQEAESG